MLQLLSMALLLLAIAQLRSGSPGAGRPRPRNHSGHVGMDGRALRQPHADGPGARPRPPLSPRAAGARPRHAGARRRADHARDRLRTGPPQGGARDPGIAAGLHGAQSGSGAAFARHIQAQAAAAPAKSRSSAPGRTAERDPARTAPPRNLRVAADCRTPWRTRDCARSACGGRTPTPTFGRSYVSAHNYGTQPHNVNLSHRFRTSRTKPGAWLAGTQRVTLPPGAR